ncbi:ligand-binding sensor domain-containing protein [Xanthomarina sp. F2636L]|uniref:ligand-binding sensor domain-containing protein n=1 Tax=Xanthomarina sp. F2636L TaxID=2996018 RepID=UPI00225DFC82|nr:two-component regulator propeller domain-containing protein [Xanthomarina sp. F2636L]MCX7549635.1 histidine kinase [Xanthomarina sp. F2636L]
MKNHPIYSLLILLFLSPFLSAQNSQLRSYAIEDGLPQSQVYDIIQDNIGYLWLGTQGGGLCRFNGTGFSVWNENDGLLSNYIHALYTSSDSLYIGTNLGLSIKTKNKFSNIECPQVNLFYKSLNTLYLGTKQGLYSYSSSDKLKRLSLHPDIDSSIVNGLVFDGSHYWIATNTGLWKANRLEGTVQEIEKIETNNFRSIVYSHHKIFAATYRDGILILDTKQKEAPILLREPLGVNAMTLHNKNEIWVATDNDGITIIDAENYSEKRNIDKESGLSVSHIRKTFSDRQSNIWIATSGGGFYKYFQNNFHHIDASSGLKGNRIYAVHHVNNSIWISNSEAGLTKIDSLGIHDIPKIKGFSNVKIKTITSDDQGNIWAGSDGLGVLLRTTKTVDSLVLDNTDSLNINTKVFPKTVIKNQVLNSENGFPFDWIRKLVKGKNTMWAATYSSGLVQFHYNADKDSVVIQEVYGKKSGITDLYINDLALDSQNRLWYATQSGHLGYLKNGKHSSLGAVLNQKTAIRTLLFHQDKLFLGTAGKGIWVSKIDENSPSFKPLKGTKKMASENIYQLIFDNQGYLWAGTERGVDKIQLDQDNNIEDIYHFGRNDGFLGIETCLNAVDKDHKGHLWFGALYGLTEYIPSVGSKNTIKPEIYFKDVQVAYKSVDSLNLKAWTNTNKVLKLNPTQTQLSFAYGSVDIDHPHQIEYRSKLNNNAWSPWSKENKQNFADLAYGAHQFSAQSRNYRWEESSPITFNFFIDSPLYKKAAFQWTVIGLALVLLLILGWWYLRKIRLKNKAEKAQLQMQNHLLTLEHKALQLQMNPHFIFNVLNGIKGMAINKPDKMNVTINSFATLLRETLNNSRKDQITLAQEIKTLEQYIRVEQLMAAKPFNFSINSNCQLDPEEILVPPMLLQPFVENAIRHGILKGNKEGELQIEFNTTEHYLHCIVIDNGIGIFKSQQIKEKTDHQSMALTVTKERLASISGENALQITEIKNADGRVAGTKISFKIPLITDY